MTTTWAPVLVGIVQAVGLFGIAGCNAGDASAGAPPGRAPVRVMSVQPPDSKNDPAPANESKPKTPEVGKPATPPAGTPAETKAEPKKADAPADLPPGAKFEVREEKWPNGSPKQTSEGYVDETGEFIPHGLVTKWYEQGGMHSKIEWRHGLPDGKAEQWYYHGQLWSTGGFAEGREDGPWVRYHQNGEKHSEWTMRRGAWHGMYTEWHDNSKKRLEVEWVNGLRQGPQYMYDEQGVLMQTTDYVDSVEQP